MGAIQEITKAFEVSFGFGANRVSSKFRSHWRDEVMNSISSKRSVRCTVQCPKDYYLWVFQLHIQGIDTDVERSFATCNGLVCSPYGDERPPACPFGYHSDQEHGFPCCTSLDWLDTKQEANVA